MVARSASKLTLKQRRIFCERTVDGPPTRSSTSTDSRAPAAAAIFDGATRTEAAKIGDVTAQTVRDWVMRFNAYGLEGLIDFWAGWRPRWEGRARPTTLPKRV